MLDMVFFAIVWIIPTKHLECFVQGMWSKISL